MPCKNFGTCALAKLKNPCRASKARDLALTKLVNITRQKQLSRGRYAFFGDLKKIRTTAFIIVDSINEKIEYERWGNHSFEFFMASQ